MQQQSTTITCLHYNFNFTSLHFTSRLNVKNKKFGTLKHQTTPKINSTKYKTKHLNQTEHVIVGIVVIIVIIY